MGVWLLWILGEMCNVVETLRMVGASIELKYWSGSTCIFMRTSITNEYFIPDGTQRVTSI